MWSWVLTAIGLTCFWLAGRKVWWSWHLALIGQIFWFVYALLTRQRGFLAGVFAYSIVYSRNAIRWTREHQAQNEQALA